jgi:hypothetical protein
MQKLGHRRWLAAAAPRLLGCYCCTSAVTRKKLQTQRAASRSVGSIPEITALA